jgi:hypothetical protein
MPPRHLWASALAVVFLIAHLAFLPSTLEDIDSLNFALGIHDFDPVQHRPHPPGYPIFMALAKASRAIVPGDASALALLGAIFGALAVFPLMKIFGGFERLAGDESPSTDVPVALAVLLVLASPLFWFNAGRPLSDVTGLAVTLAAQAALVTAFVRQRVNPERTPAALASSGRMIVLGAFLSAIAIGTRTQAMWLTLPVLALVLVQRAGRGAAGALLGSAMTFAIGSLLWFVPLVFASGGLMAYRGALAAQADADFSGVDMLYRNPSLRKLAFSLLETFIYPWASPVLGWVVFALALAGLLSLLLRSPRVVVLLAVLAGPYLIVHLLVQETVTTRYALPVIPVMAYLVVKGVETIGGKVRRPAFVTTIVGLLVVWSLALTLPAERVYARAGSPAFAALAELQRRLASEPGAVGMHQTLARSAQTVNFGNARVLDAPAMRESSELARYWREGHTGPVWFLADPGRTDLELVDPLSRRLQAHYLWAFDRDRFIGGVRPDIVDLIRIDSPPGWYAEEGWHLTPETLNRSEEQRRTEGVAHIRNRPGAALLVIGAESWRDAGSVTLTLGDRQLDRWDLPARGTVFKRIALDPGALAGESGFTRIVASYADAAGKPQTVRLTQFAVADPGQLFFVQQAGWNEIEYGRAIQRRWRWTTGRAETFVNTGGRDVTLTLAGESPLRYFDTAPRVTIRAGSQVLATAEPSDDFELNVKVPASALAAADGMLTIETNQAFVPNERSGSPDRRTLGLRLFTFELR